eukprot:TRINITY_DN3728_c0_g1_i11.p1 TRINITY_DN3728_c0_g1~~TRINITY_DN3728_c0_g1_i11.p1  ORF type:complete len:741 (-),score=134.00 TRINITY_DN3728_c0_g1_i11:254-2476(-)
MLKSDETSMPMTLDVEHPFLPIGLKGKRKKRKRDPVTVCTANCRGSYKVVSQAVNNLGWQDLQKTSETTLKPASVIWAEHTDHSEGAAPVQIVSRIEAFLQFCKKAKLANCLNAWEAHLPDVFSFSPKTWILPQDSEELRVAMMKGSKDETYIAKPTAGAQGKGIILIKQWKDLAGILTRTKASEGKKTNPCEYVVQRYLSHPLLLGGLKFDMRLYMIVTSVVPMRAYLFKEGLARFCTVPYEAPNDENMKKGNMHLTNFAINKKSKDFQAAEGWGKDESSSKRSVSSVFRQIQEAYGTDPEDLWSKVASLAANTLMAMRPGLLEYYVHDQQKPLHPIAPKGFQLIGLDVIIDGDMEPRLLELNANASLSAVQPGSADQAAASDEDCAEVANQGSNQTPKIDLSEQAQDAEITEAAEKSSRVLRGLGKRSKKGLSASTGMLQGDLARKIIRSSSLTDYGSPANLTATGTGLGSSCTINTTSLATSSAAKVSRPGSANARNSKNRGSSRTRSHSDKMGKEKSTSKASKEEVSELDLLIKRELVAQALLLVRPAPQNKTNRLKRQWVPRDKGDIVPLNDDGSWALSGKQKRSEAVRDDAPDRCPGMEPVEFDDAADPEVVEFAKYHLLLYRCWLKHCGSGHQTLSQAQILRLFEKGLLIGEGAGSLFPDRITGQLWISRTWRVLAEGNFGLNFAQFTDLAGRVGDMLLARSDPDYVGMEPGSLRMNVVGIFEFARQVLLYLQ